MCVLVSEAGRKDTESHRPASLKEYKKVLGKSERLASLFVRFAILTSLVISDDVTAFDACSSSCSARPV
jgi:hypothetical protein